MQRRGTPKLAVFLGNPGRQYQDTRHNVGWMVLGQPPFGDIQGWQRKFKGWWVRGPGNAVLLRPETMMNRSGESAQAACRFFRIDPEEIIVVHDDVELSFGTIFVRFGGGLAGHNGLRSISAQLSTPDFFRMRVGIGRPQRGSMQSHVLGRFNSAEEGQLDGVLRSAAAMLEGTLTGHDANEIAPTFHNPL